MSSSNKDASETPPGLTLRRALQGHEDVIHRLCWSPAGDRLASASRDRTIRIWDGASGDCLEVLKVSDAQAVNVGFAPDGKTLVASSVLNQDNLHLWDLIGDQAARSQRGDFGVVTHLAWSPDSQALATVSNNGAVRLWDAELKKARLVMKRHPEALQCIAWTPGGRRFAAGSAGARILIWDVEEMKQPLTLDAKNAGAVYDIAWIDERTIAAACDDGDIRVWNIESGEAPERLAGHKAGVISLSVSGDGSFLASKSLDGTVRVWSLEILESLAVLPEPAGGSWLSDICFHPSELLLATLGEKDRLIRLWELDADMLLGGP